MTDDEREAMMRRAQAIVDWHPNTAATFLLGRLDRERGISAELREKLNQAAVKLARARMAK